MKPIKIKGFNATFAENQDEYQNLPAIRLSDGTVITAWEISDEELKIINETKVIYLNQLTFKKPLQPVLLTTDLSELVDYI